MRQIQKKGHIRGIFGENPPFFGPSSCVFEISFVSLVGVRTYVSILRPTQNPTLAGMDPLVLVQKHHILTYNCQYGNEFVVNIPHRPTFKMTKDGLFYHDMMHLLKNKNNAHIMVNYSQSPIPQVK